MSTFNITELGESTREAQLALGIRQDTVWHNYFNVISPIVKLHLKHGKEEFDYGVVNVFLREKEKRMIAGEISISTYPNYKRTQTELSEAMQR